MARLRYSAADILRQLDDCAGKFTFPMLDNGYVYPADVRLHAYRDRSRWALVIEVLGYHPRAFCATNCLYCYGNCLKRPPGTANEDFLDMLGETPDQALFEGESGTFIRAGLRSVRIRDTVVWLRTGCAALASKGIELEHPPKLQVFELLRSLLPEHRDLLLATEDELWQRVPPDLPCVLRLEEWNHPDLCGDELPSRSETFRMIAEVLALGDVSHYRPTQPPNTHWSNWPAGGTL